jgi:Na+-translocating ferredoxin:NAD+ oxidoreductase RnfC subunit
MRSALCLATLSLLLAGAAAAQPNPGQANPKEDPIILKGSPLGGVKFEHQKHVVKSENKCETCHHPSRAEKPSERPQQSCQSCHTKVAVVPMKTNAAAAFHGGVTAARGVCVDCHKAENAKGGKAPVAPRCAECHKKENI